MKKRILAALLAALTALTVLSAVTVLPVLAGRIDNWDVTKEDGGFTIFLYHGENTKVEFPSELEGTPVKAIRGRGESSYRSLFYPNNSTIKRVTVPDSVTKIGHCSFYECTKMTSAAIGKNVTVIGYFAFKGCHKLKEITLPDCLRSIGNDAFEVCSDLTSIVIPDSVTNLGKYAFSYCTSLTSVTLGSGLTIIKEHTFDSCWSLESITIPAGVSEICYHAFYGCESLKSITIPAGMTVFGDSVFGDCDSLETIYYGGTREQWNSISVGYYNEALDSVTIYYNHPAHSMTYVPSTAICTEGGTAAHYHCSLCGKDFLDEAGNTEFTGQTESALGHEGGDWTVTTDATCTEAGVETQFCTRCGDPIDTREIFALGHDYQPISTTAPTCTEAGFTTFVCSRCGDTYNSDGQSAPGHYFSDWTVTSAPTCTASGVETRYCSRCETVERRTIEPRGHSYSKWEMVTEETCTTDGEERRVCSVCGSVETLVRPARGHSFSYGNCTVCWDEDPSVPKLNVSDAVAAPGETFELTVSVSRNPGISSLMLGLDYDENSLVLENVENGDLFDEIADFNPFDGSTGTVFFDSASNVTGDGVLMTLTFTVNDEAQSDWYDVGVFVRAAYDENGDDVDFLWFEGIVDVIVYGDASEDGTVDVTDVILISQYILDNTVYVSPGADADGDGAVDITDVILISQYILDSSVVLGP